MLTTPILSVMGKLRLAAEYFVLARRAGDNKSLAAFARRRFGRETYERLIQPLVGGIYTADPEKLSLKATLPKFAEMEHRHRSLIRAAWRDQSANDAASPAGGVRDGLFTAPRDGMASLVSSIAARLPQGVIHLSQPIEALSRDEAGQWRVAGPAGAVFAPFDAVIVAAPAPRGAAAFHARRGIVRRDCFDRVCRAARSSRWLRQVADRPPAGWLRIRRAADRAAANPVGQLF